jgi:hypothetical protein
VCGAAPRHRAGDQGGRLKPHPDADNAAAVKDKIAEENHHQTHKAQPMEEEFQGLNGHSASLLILV